MTAQAVTAIQGLNAFASGRLDVELDEATPLAYRDAFAARQPSGWLPPLAPIVLAANGSD